jgi:Transposase, Mutator family
MTDARQALFELIEKPADADFVRELLAFGAERLMAVEVEALTGAAHGERSPERVNHRNGYRDRAWESSPSPTFSRENCGSARSPAPPRPVRRAGPAGQRSARPGRRPKPGRARSRLLHIHANSI